MSVWDKKNLERRIDPSQSIMNNIQNINAKSENFTKEHTVNEIHIFLSLQLKII